MPMVVVAENEPMSIPDPGMILFNALGQPVAVVTRIESRCDRHDVTSDWDTSVQYTSGPTTVELTAIMTGSINTIPGTL